ncbi:DegV family protein [Lysinibacillus sp. KU-BSD001]|uniref:DegV family protein n=1 Tax=Lysinibacillus sp. KU-BSD001 TaxID=3141328 RepID=UPI0036F427AE
MIKITADSTCDLPPNILNALNITVTPLHVLVDHVNFRDGIDITQQDLFKYVEVENKKCTTAAINIYEYEEFFAPFAKAYEAVIHINVGARFSSCYANAKMAAQRFDNVYIIDSQNFSTGSGHLVYDAALLAKQGYPAEEIVEKIEAIVPKLDTSFVMNRLDYLKKGGRCTNIELFATTLLKIKPAIEVRNGEMIVGKKYRGPLLKCLENYIKDRLQNNRDIDYSRLFITHSMCPPEIVEQVKASVIQYVQFHEVIEAYAGTALSVHAGPHTLGLFYKRK